MSLCNNEHTDEISHGLKIRPFSEWQWQRIHFSNDSPDSTGVALDDVAEALDDSDNDSEKSVGDDIACTVYDVPTSVNGPEYFSFAQGGKKLVIVMVGLPARGKTFLAQKLCRLLGWNGFGAQVLNVQVLWKEKLRRFMRECSPSPRIDKSPPKVSDEIMDFSGAFPISNNIYPKPKPRVILVDSFESLLLGPHSNERRLYLEALSEYAKLAKNFFSNGGLVTIINDDFPTVELRNEVEKYFYTLADDFFYIEVQRDNRNNVIFDNLKVQDPEEYNPRTGLSPDQTINDFYMRVDLINKIYEPFIPLSGKPYIKLKDTSVIEAHGVRGFLPGKIVSFLMNLSQMKISHPIYFCRHGQSTFNLDDRLGGDPDLTEKGRGDAEAVCEFIASLKNEIYSKFKDEENGSISLRNEKLFEIEEKDLFSKEVVVFSDVPDDDNCDSYSNSSCVHFTNHMKPPNRNDCPDEKIQIWTSQLKRTIQTAAPAEKRLKISAIRWSNLNEIHTGVCDSMTYNEVKEKYPLIHRFRGENKYSFRYPKGESYQDLVARLEPVISELENANRVIFVVAHQAVLRALLAYFGSTSAESCVNVDVPHRTIWRCTYNSKGIAQVDCLKLAKPFFEE